MEDARQRLSFGPVVAALDQAHASLDDVARMLGGYREQLVTAGFGPEEAFELCADLQHAIMLELDERRG